MKKLISLVLSLSFAVIMSAQTDSVDYYSPSRSKPLSKDGVSASVSMGASVSFLNNTNNTAFTTFVAPKIGYQLTPKFKLNFGLMHYTITGNSFMPLNQNEALFNTNNKIVTGNLLFVEGKYKLNNRLIMSGAVMYDANGVNINKKDNCKAASLGLEYKTSEHSSIKFETTVTEGKGNYNNSPNPFSTNGYSSFGTGFSNENSLFR
jgi:hypothetical protein